MWNFDACFSERYNKFGIERWGGESNRLIFSYSVSMVMRFSSLLTLFITFISYASTFSDEILISHWSGSSHIIRLVANVTFGDALGLLSIIEWMRELDLKEVIFSFDSKGVLDTFNSFISALPHQVKTHIAHNLARWSYIIQMCDCYIDVCYLNNYLYNTLGQP